MSIQQTGMNMRMLGSYPSKNNYPLMGIKNIPIGVLTLRFMPSALNI